MFTRLFQIFNGEELILSSYAHCSVWKQLSLTISHQKGWFFPFFLLFAVAIFLSHVAVSVEGKEYESSNCSARAPCEDTELCIPSFTFA